MTHQQCIAGRNCVISVGGSGAYLSPLQIQTTQSFYCIPCSRRAFDKRKLLKP